MQIEHIAMYVEDLERSRAFFETYFGASAKELYENKKKEFQSYFLTFDDGARLELMHVPNLKAKEKVGLQRGFSHIAFSTGSAEKVDALTQKLKEDGFLVVSGPRTTGDGYYESCVIDLEGNQIEITV